MRGWLMGLCLVLGPAAGAASCQEPVPVAADWSDLADSAVPYSTWTRLDYLLWWVKPVCEKPPTVTTSNATAPNAGALGEPGTTVVLGGSKFEFAGSSGLQPTFGIWFTPDRAVGFEASAFLLEQRAVNQSVVLGSGDAPGYLPYQSPAHVQEALPFSIPGVVDAGALAVGRTRLWGTEANLLTGFQAQRGPCLLSATYLFGFRQLDLSESVELTNLQRLVADPTQFAAGHNSFQTRNQFYGAQIGGRFGLQWDRFEVETGLKVAVGETRLSVAISGGPLVAGAAVLPDLLPGPLLALPSNSGRVTTWRLSVVPEADVRFSYRIGEALRLTLGYHVLYLNRNVCPGDQMSTTINVTQLPGNGPVVGPLQPKNPFARTDYYAGGLVAGVEWRY